MMSDLLGVLVVIGSTFRPYLGKRMQENLQPPRVWSFGRIANNVPCFIYSTAELMQISLWCSEADVATVGP